MSDLVLPTGVKPSNLNLPEGVSTQYIDSDVFDICDRLKEISPDLYVMVMQGRPGTDFVIMEACKDGVERAVFRVGSDWPIDALDNRVVERCRRLAALPINLRLKAIEREIDKHEEKRQDNELEELYERMGRPMWTELERTGFIQRPVSYPKVGVAAGGKRAR